VTDPADPAIAATVERLTNGVLFEDDARTSLRDADLTLAVVLSIVHTEIVLGRLEPEHIGGAVFAVSFEAASQRK